MDKILLKPKYAFIHIAVALLFLFIVGIPLPCHAASPEPYVAIHVSELTQALETMPAVPPTPTGDGNSGKEWWYKSWHYFVAYESLKEALHSDGTPFVVVSDSDIAAGKLLQPDGSPRYPIVISLMSEAVGDNEIAPLRSYVNSGGFLFIGGSAFTRNPDGTTRGDFALANEMKLHMANPGLINWYQMSSILKNGSNRLTDHIPSGLLPWNGALTSEDISWGVSPDHLTQTKQYAWNVTGGGATVVAFADIAPLLALSDYGQGKFIYHAAMQPILGHGGYDPGMYEYLVFRKAIEWAYESFSMPLLKVSPWRYQYDAAAIFRHDFENFQDSIKGIKSSAQYETSFGAKGDYFFCTGTLRDDMKEDPATIADLRSAVSQFGATIGSHNGGLKNPVNLSLTPEQMDYWHWGPDEALDLTPPPQGYTSGKDYATASIQGSFNDIERWFAGVDNGRPGCGTAGNCPRTWVAPYFNGTREDSRTIIEQLGAVVSGEQKISPFPHRTMSYKTPGSYFSSLSLPVSDWFVGSQIAQSNDSHTIDSIRSAVDFYYNLGALINFYGHSPSDTGTIEREYVSYCASKAPPQSRLWLSNSLGIYDWWQLRLPVTVTPMLTTTGSTYVLTATVSGAADPDTAVEIVLPPALIGTANVFLNGTLGAPSEFRATPYGVKVRVGTTITRVRVQNTPNSPPVASSDAYSTNSNTPLIQAAPGVLANDSDAEGASLKAQLVTPTSHGTVTLNADGSFTYTPAGNYAGADTFTYVASDGTADSSPATVTIAVLNLPPTAVNDVYTTRMNTALVQAAPGVLANDSDPEKAPLTAQLVAGPSHGTVALNSDGSFTYTPSTNYIGSDSFTYTASDGIVTGNVATVTLTVDDVLFQDDFTRDPVNTKPLSPWISAKGTWSVAGGVLKGASSSGQYASAYITTSWDDYSVEGRVQFPAGAFGGGIGGRVNPTTGARYSVWIYPAGSRGGANMLKLVKMHDWTTWSFTPMQQVSLPDVGTGWHALKVVFNGSRIQVYYDGTLMIDTVDGNFDSIGPFMSGGVSADMWTDASPYQMTVDDVVVRYVTSNLPPVAGNDTFATGAGVALSQAAPGVLANDSDPEGATLTAQLVRGTSHGTLSLNADGSFSYAPLPNYVGTDSFTYVASDGAKSSGTATVTVAMTSAGILFSDDFARAADAPTPLHPWSSATGTWAINGGVLEGSSSPTTYASIYTSTTPLWTDYAVQATVQMPAGAFGGGIGGRVNPATGARYSAWIYPAGSLGGSNMLKLVKMHDWTTWSGTPMQQVSLPDVGTGPHTLKLAFNGSKVQVFYDGALMIDVTDSGFDGIAPYLSGGISGDMWTYTNAYVMKVDNVVVTSLLANSPPTAVADAYTTRANTPLNQAAPGVLANDSDPEGATLTARLVTAPSHGTLTLNANGSFIYTPAADFAGSDSFTYTASDGMASSNVAVSAVIVVAADLPPVAVNDSYTTGAGTQLNQAAPGVLWNDTDPEGGTLTAQLVTGPSHGALTLNADGSFSYAPLASYVGTDSFTYSASDGSSSSTPATVSIASVSSTGVLFSDDFTRTPGGPNALSPWVSEQGSWTLSNGVLQGSSLPSAYASISMATAPPWTDYAVQARVQFPAGAFGGGIGGRVDPATGARYGAWIYPAGSLGGSNLLKLVKFRDWTTWNFEPMQQVSIPDVGTGWHTLKMTFTGNRIQVSYDGTALIDVTDTTFDSRGPYLSGGISGDMWTYNGSCPMGLDDVVVTTLGGN